MITLGINEFIRNIKRNILVIAQMIAIYMLAIFIVSAFEEQYSLYDGMSKGLDDTGAVMLGAIPLDRTENYVSEEGLYNLLDKVENVVMTYGDDFAEKEYTHRDVMDEIILSIKMNDPDLITHRPKLTSGTWCEDAPSREGMINVVVSNNTKFDFRVGDVIEMEGKKLYITGLFATDEPVYGFSGNSASENTNYLHFYQCLMDSAETANTCFVLADYDEYREACQREYITGKIIIDFEDDITEEEYSENMKRIKEYYGHVENRDIYNSKLIYDNSLTHLEIKLVPMFVLLGVALFVLLVSMMTTSAINILYEKKNYGIYFICGNSWKKTFVISAVHWFTVSVSSIVIAISGCLLMKASGEFDSLTLSFSPLHVWAILAIMLVALIASLILPYNMLRKIQPVSILKENDD